MTYKVAHGFGHALSFVPSKTYSVFCNGLLILLNGSKECSNALKDRNIVKLTVGSGKVLAGSSFVVLGALFTALLSVPYLLGKICKSFGSPTVHVKFGTVLENASTPTDDLVVFNLNCALGNKILRAVNFGGEKFGYISNQTRIQEILNSIEEQKADVVTLQEVFDPDAASLIAEKLAEKGYTTIYNAGTPCIGYNSGLLIAVKNLSTPFQADFEAYKDFAGVDRFASKGILAVKIPYGENRSLIVATSHLMASSKEQVQIRDAQMRQALDLIQRIKENAENKEIHVLFCGDFNCYDTGVNQAIEWVNDYPAGPLPSAGRNILNGFSDNLDSIISKKVNAEEVKENTPSSDQAETIKKRNELLVRFLCNYCRCFPIAAENFEIGNYEAALEAQLAAIGKIRKLEIPQNLTLEQKLQILLHQRDPEILAAELRFAEMLAGETALPSPTKCHEELRNKLSALMSKLLANPDQITSFNLWKALSDKTFAAIMHPDFREHRNDRIFHSSNLQGRYKVDMNAKDVISDHPLIIGKYKKAP